MAKDNKIDVIITGFAGMDNLQDAARLRINQDGSAECASIINFDISDTLSASTRGGFSKFYSGTPHSLDRNGSGLFVEGNNLKLLLPDLSGVVTLNPPLKAPSLPMSYAKVNYLTVCSNGVDLFMVQSGVITPFSVPTANFKEAIQPAQIVAYFNRRLYYAIGPVLYHSDTDNIEQSDTRDQEFAFNAPITMVMPLDNGIYVGADKVYWLAGRAPEDFAISGAVFDSEVIFGTDQIFDGSFIAERGQVGHPYLNALGKWGAFTTLNGVCLCNDNGRVINETEKTINFKNNKLVHGGSLIKYGGGISGDINQYISWTYQF